jgi:hypothetical protein
VDCFPAATAIGRVVTEGGAPVPGQRVSLQVPGAAGPWVFERETARLTGKEAALFLPSGVTYNLVALLGHFPAGEPVVVEADAA